MISFIIPTLQEEKRIESTLKRIKERVTVPHEIIVADGASADTTAEIARALADTVVISPKERRSPARQRNDGARAARGDVLVFMDGDSFLLDIDSSMRSAMARFAEDESLMALAVPQLVDPKEARFGDRIVFTIDNLIVGFMNNVLHHGAGAGKCMIIRRSAFERAGGFNEALIFREDADIFARISKFGKTRSVRDFAVYHSGRRIHKLGFWHFLYVWLFNGMHSIFFDKSHITEWEPIR